MTRDILFRGKRLDKAGKGQWAYGSLLTMKHSIKKDPSMSPMIMEDATGATYAVDPETVGQYIGRHDKNNKEIYEDDMVVEELFNDGEIEPAQATLSVVVYGRNNAFLLHSNSEWPWSGFDEKSWNKYEVTGNRHDNPELTEGVV